MLTVNAQTYAVVVHRADDQTLRFTVVDSTGAVVDVSSGAFKFTVKRNLDDDIADAAFQLTSPAGNGIDLTSAASGIVDVNIATGDTDDLAGLYHYDLEMTLSAKVRTLRSGLFYVQKDVTTSGTAPSTTVTVIDYPNGISTTALYLQDSATGLWIKCVNDGGFPSWAPSDVGPPPF